MPDDVQLAVKMGILEEKTKAAHARLDKFEIGVRDDLKLIYDELKSINAHVNRSKGWAAASVLLATVFGGAIATGIIFLLKHGA